MAHGDVAREAYEPFPGITAGPPARPSMAEMPRSKVGRNAGDGSPDRDTSEPAPPDIDWETPRWRKGDEVQGDVERTRRLRGDRAPAQPGAVDNARSIDPDPAGAREPRSARTD